LDNGHHGADSQWRVQLLRWCLILDRNTLQRALKEIAELNRQGFSPHSRSLIRTAVSVSPAALNIVSVAAIGSIGDLETESATMVLAAAERAARQKGLIVEARNFNAMHRCVSEIMGTLEHGLEDRLFAPVEAARDNLELGGMTVSTCPVLPNGCVIDLVGVLRRDARLRQVVRRLNPGASVTSREIHDGPSHETAVLVTAGSPGSDGRA
jgi:hypothetical protein